MRWRLLKNSGRILVATGVALLAATHPTLATTTVQSQVCEDFMAPAIVSPSDGLETKDATVMIEGTGEPGKSVTLRRNGATQAVGMVASDGTFGFSVGLVDGDNVLVARETNECDTAKDSSAVTVRADLAQPPTEEPPVEPSNGGQSGAGSQPENHPDVGSIGTPLVPRPATRGFPKPKINTSNKDLTVYLDTLLIDGTAYPGSFLTVYVNGKVQAQLYSMKDGTFRLRVVLREGRNTLRVRSEYGSKTAVSDEVKVTYIKRVTARLSRPLSREEVIATAAMAGAAVVGAAAAALGANVFIHRYGAKLKWWRK